MLCWVGYTGDVIIFQDDKFIVNPAIYKPNQFETSEHNILTASEAELINKMASLGALYKLIKEFIDKYSGLSSSLALNLAYGAKQLQKKDGKKDEDLVDSDDGNADEDGQDQQQLHGVYIKAFCSGVNEMLTVY